jgi:hypothetical protein
MSDNRMLNDAKLNDVELDDAELDAVVGGSQGGDSVRGGYHPSSSFGGHDRRR